MSESNNAIQLLLDEMIEFNRLYHDHGKSVIPDEEYDLKREKLTHWLRSTVEEGPHPLRVKVRKFLDIVGGVAGEESHGVPMLSLENKFSAEAVLKWILKAGRTSTYLIESKYDGMSLSVEYVEGLPQIALTRGDGSKGKVQTDKIKYIPGIPRKLKSVSSLTIRGEVVVLKDHFAKVVEAAVAAGEKPPSNERNYTAGVLGRINAREVEGSGLIFIPYRVIGPDKRDIPRTRWSGYFNNLHVDTDTCYMEAFQYKTDEALLECIEAIIEHNEKRRHLLGYATDGLVFKLLDPDVIEELGDSTHHPRWSVAYKFPAEEVWTKVTGFTFSIGRTGVVTPVVHIEPVRVSGAKVSRANVYNLRRIRDQGIKVGCEVGVIRSGEVIPVIKSVKPMEGEGPDIEHCPCCHSTLRYTLGEEFCPNTDCSERVVRRLAYFFSVGNADVKGLGEKMLRELITHHIPDLRYPSQVYELTVDQLSEAFGEKTGIKVYNELVKSKGMSPAKALWSLGITDVGRSTATEACEALASLGCGIHSFTGKVTICSSLPNTDKVLVLNMDAQDAIELGKLHDLGVYSYVEKKTGPYSGKVFFITGSFHISRSEIKGFLEELGGVVVDTPNKRCTHALVGSVPSESKVKRANKLKLAIWDQTILIEEIKLYNQD